MDWFDCLAGFGIAGKPPARFSATAADLIEELDFCGVKEALVFRAPAAEEAPQTGNRCLIEETRDHPRLHPTWAVLPPQTGELGTMEQWLGEMRANGVRALRAYPQEHKYLLNGITFGPLLEEMVARRIPLLAGPEWETLTSLLRDFPELRLLVVAHGGWGDDRYFRPLLDRYPGFHVDISFYHQDQGLPGLVARYGPDRFLYGSGHPEYQMGGALMYVSRAEIRDDARAAIAGGNLRRLLGEVGL